MNRARTQDDRSRAAEDSTARFGIVRVCDEERSKLSDAVSVEEPLEMRLLHGLPEKRQMKSIAVTMRTPGHDRELAAGFLFTEGVITDPTDIAAISRVVEEAKRESGSQSARATVRQRSSTNSISIELHPDVVIKTASLERNFYTTSSCGICGKASLLALRAVCPALRPNTMQVSAGMICSLPGKLRAAQDAFEATGGLHGAGLFSKEGELRIVREDVGRHNAVDKLIGNAFLAERAPLLDHILLLSGRASFELLQKAVMAGIQTVAAVGAPSSLAVRVAREFDVTLIGFLRGNRFNIYHGAERVLR